MAVSDSPNGRATIREVYKLVDERFDKLERKMDEKFSEHENMHEQDRNRRTSALRWGVGIIFTVMMLLVAWAPLAEIFNKP